VSKNVRIPVFRKVGPTIREYATGEDAVFDFGLTSATGGFHVGGDKGGGHSFAGEGAMAAPRGIINLFYFFNRIASGIL